MIRPAAESDIDRIVVLGKAMRDESPRYSVVAWDEAKARQLVQSVLSAGGLFVVVWDGEIVGMLGGVVVEHIFSFEKFAVDLVVYVVPILRGSSAGLRLIRAFEGWAWSRGADEVVLGVSTEIACDRTSRLYEVLGYRESGRSFIKRRSNV